MSEQYIRYPSSGGGGGGGVLSINSLTGAITLAAGSGITITPSGNTLTLASTTSGANTALSNLTTTSINQSLLFGSDATNDIGAAGASRPRSAYINTSVLIGASNPMTISRGTGGGVGNIAIGLNAAVGDGDHNVMIGDGAAVSHGNFNTCIGYLAGADAAYTGNGLVCIGGIAGTNTQGNSNTYVGAFQVSNFLSSGNQNTFLGNSCGQSLRSASNNVLVGFGAGNALSSGPSNVLIGSQAGDTITTEEGNVVIGQQGLSGGGTGAGNVYIGQGVAYQATGNNNVFIGQIAGSTVLDLGPLSGHQNILLGYQASPTDAAASNECVFAGAYKFYFYDAGNNSDSDQRPIGLFFPGVIGTNVSVSTGQVDFWAPPGTGTGAGGNFTFNVAPAGSSGSTNNPWVPTLHLDNTGPITIGNSTLLSKHILNTATETAASGAGTLLNMPSGVSGNPALYIKITINGTDYVLPAWTA